MATFELLANVETVENASTEVVLDGKVGVTGNAGAQAGFDSSKLADLAAAITIILENGELPDAALLRAQFTPAASPVPTVLVLTPSPAVYDDLLDNTQHMEMAA